MKSYSTLADMKKTIEESSSASGTGKRFIYLRDGDNYKVRFRQELTEDGANHSDEAGTSVVVPVVTSPINWKYKAMSTAASANENYRCWATEQIGNDKRWKPRPVLLINAAVEIEPGKWEPRIIETVLTNPRHIGQTIIEYAETYGTITDRYYKFSRTGSGPQDTSYTLIPLESADEPEAITNLQMHDLDNVYKVIPYAQQEAFFTTGEVASSGGGW
jgi:hypothetical protein